MAADIAKLTTILTGAGWTIDGMTRAIGQPIDAAMPVERKRLVWGIVNTPGAREWLARVRIYFPEATISSVRLRESLGA